MLYVYVPEQPKKVWVDQGGVLVLEEVPQLVHHQADVLLPLLLLARVDQDVDVGRSGIGLMPTSQILFTPLHSLFLITFLFFVTFLHLFFFSSLVAEHFAIH